MSTIRKLSAFRQLSLNYESSSSPLSEQRRKSFKKQLSVDVTDINRANKEMKMSLSRSAKSAHNRSPIKSIKIAWQEESINRDDEGVIVTKCEGIRRQPPTKLISRHNSLEKDTITYSKQELTDRLRDALNNKQKDETKTNLNIFLAHNTRDNNDEGIEEFSSINVPKFIQPLMVSKNEELKPTKNVFQIRKTPSPPKTSAVVVIPLVERDVEEIIEPNVVIRPATAAARRERFQKRTNSAFNTIMKDDRPPLIRSLSAPTKPQMHKEQNKGKFLATKRKIKRGKSKYCGNDVMGKMNPSPRTEDEEISNKENPKNKREMNRYVPTVGLDVVTMVSLISPSASDNEEVEEKPAVKKSQGSPVKTSIRKDDGHKNISLRKTVKSVSFQQSSIHAVRSFSTSFPARRTSMATALMLGSAASLMKNHQAQKLEKRTTNPSTSVEERGAKRRFVRSFTEHQDPSSESLQEDDNNESDYPQLNVEIKTKDDTDDGVGEPENASHPSPHPENQEFGSAKEKQCWDMYCKMSNKGITIAYDTILRGMLTPTEYRMRKKYSLINNTMEDNTNNQTTPDGSE